MNAQMREEFQDWLIGRPQIIIDIAQKLPPWNLYRLKTTGQHCRLISYFEDGTIRVEIVGHDSQLQNAINQAIPLDVFGIAPEDLELIAEPKE